MKAAQLLVVLAQFTLSLEHTDLHLGLAISSSAKSLALLGRDGRVSCNQATKDSSQRFNSQRQGLTFLANTPPLMAAPMTTASPGFIITSQDTKIIDYSVKGSGWFPTGAKIARSLSITFLSFPTNTTFQIYPD